MCEKMDVWNTRILVKLNEILEQFIPRIKLMPDKNVWKEGDA